MKTRKQKETSEKELHLLEQKGHEKMANEIPFNRRKHISIRLIKQLKKLLRC